MSENRVPGYTIPAKLSKSHEKRLKKQRKREEEAKLNNERSNVQTVEEPRPDLIYKTVKQPRPDLTYKEDASVVDKTDEPGMTSSSNEIPHTETTKEFHSVLDKTAKDQGKRYEEKSHQSGYQDRRHEGHRNRSREGHQDTNRDDRRDRSREGRRDQSRERPRNRSRESHQGRSHEGHQERTTNYGDGQSRQSFREQQHHSHHQYKEKQWKSAKPSQQYGNPNYQHAYGQAFSTFPSQSYHSRSYDEGGKQYEINLSKELVRILRHGSYKFIKLNDEGFANVDQILADQRFSSKFPGVTLEMVEGIVESNDKKRFELERVGGHMMIRAAQGHTVKVANLNLTPVTDSSKYPGVVHGTYWENWEFIKMEGLKRMERTHIHFSIGMPNDSKVISGMRGSCEIVIRLDLEKALNDGIKFFVSSNRVILTEGDQEGKIHPKYFQQVVNLYPYQMIHFEVPPDFDKGSKKSSKKDSWKMSETKGALH